MGDVGEDPRWDKFAKFHDYLLEAFPLTSVFLYIYLHRCSAPSLTILFSSSHATLKLTKVHTYGLVFNWQGSDASLKPALYTGHQGWPGSFVHVHHDQYIVEIPYIPSDVVPVDPDTVDKWTHPPYSGYYDGISFLDRSLASS